MSTSPEGGCTGDLGGGLEQERWGMSVGGIQEVVCHYFLGVYTTYMHMISYDIR